MPSKVLVAASTKPLVLSILQRGKNYGYRIIKEVEELSGGSLQWTDAMLYPVLKRMEKEGLITSQWVRSEAGRRRKYYEITPEGEQQVARDRQEWLDINRIFARLWAVDTGLGTVKE